MHDYSIMVWTTPGAAIGASAGFSLGAGGIHTCSVSMVAAAASADSIFLLISIEASLGLSSHGLDGARRGHGSERRVQLEGRGDPHLHFSDSSSSSGRSRQLFCMMTVQSSARLFIEFECLNMLVVVH